MKPADLVRLLDLKPHPEGGFYRETFRDTAGPGGRARSTAIYYLLSAGERSHWHRIDAAEVWHFYTGEALELSVADDNGRATVRILGNNLALRHQPQIVVPPGFWQSARPLGAYALVGCTVAPGFEFEKFEMAAPGWEPAQWV